MVKQHRLFLGVVLWLGLSPVSTASADEQIADIAEEGSVDTYYVQGEGALSYLGEIGAYEAVAGTFSYGARGGHRWGDWGAFLQAEHNIWVLTDIGETPVDSVLNLGVGGEVLYYEQQMRTSMALGTSTILFDTILDDFGTTGFFIETRAMSYRVPLDEEVILEFSPLTFIVMVPIIEGIPLVQLAYRSAFAAEVKF